ncbi:1,4-dihydroxy-2-naphthoate octaprenyltransferase [Ilumatobacter coccineus YM16-304]|uniref:1,4-dihydroxy-2-naphthoate octaprenyltransferase n=2 Tax=Ilumatobacter coccineus TaxID=467094 RepID=A0A6C7E9L7_ILUCY|nr:1,4-dihydroxy-2-naphthoate octaprenyltransferase [Ilumatobacter coccineus YM16-304]
MNRWMIGARLRTLPAAVVPVALGAACGLGTPRELGWWSGDGVVVSADHVGVVWWRVALALIVSLALQVGVNYANDYSDGIRGTDDVRVGPQRLVASGLAPAKQVKMAAMAAFGVAAVAGLAVAVSTSLWLLAVGAAAIAAGWFYTGGPKPYGYLGLGEIFVFVFFGLVATVGTTFAATETITWLSIAMGSAAGSLACALLVINNLRDIPTDREVGKQTLAVRLGDARTRWFYVLLVVASFALLAVAAFERPWALLGFAAAPLAFAPSKAVLGGATGPALIPVLGATGKLQLAFGFAATVGLAISS